MARPKLAIIDIARCIYWYDLTAEFLKYFYKIDTDEGFSNFFHEGLEIDGDSNIFWKIKRGRTTLGEKWIKRIETKEPMTLLFYNHFLWKLLKNPPKDSTDTLELIRSLPINLSNRFFIDSDNNEQRVLNKNDLIEIKELYSLDSLGFLFLLHILGKHIHSIDLINNTSDLIHQSFEKISLQPGLSRTHILLFDLLEKKTAHIKLNGYSKPLYIFYSWRGTRDAVWTLENRSRSHEFEKKLAEDKVLDTKIVKRNFDLENLAGKFKKSL